MCTRESHEDLKRVRRTFVAATTFQGWQEDPGNQPYELRLCRGCHSTICDGTRREPPMPAALLEAHA